MQKVLVIPSTSRNLIRLRNRLRPFLKKAGFPEEVKEGILVAVSEGCTNAIRHAYREAASGKIRLTFQDQKGKVVFRIRDYGRKIDLAKVKPPQLPPQKGGGLGIYFMKTIMDKVEYNMNHSRGNELILTKYKEKGVSHENSR